MRGETRCFDPASKQMGTADRCAHFVWICLQNRYRRYGGTRRLCGSRHRPEEQLLADRFRGDHSLLRSGAHDLVVRVHPGCRFDQRATRRRHLAPRQHHHLIRSSFTHDRFSLHQHHQTTTPNNSPPQPTRATHAHEAARNRGRGISASAGPVADEISSRTMPSALAARAPSRPSLANGLRLIRKQTQTGASPRRALASTPARATGSRSRNPKCVQRSRARNTCERLTREAPRKRRAPGTRKPAAPRLTRNPSDTRAQRKTKTRQAPTSIAA